MSTHPAIAHLRDYVAIPSVNPMGRDDLDPAISCERRYAEHLREQLRRLGLDAELVGDPARPSVVAEASAPGATDTLMVASHLDTVPVDGMEIDPFDPRVEGDRLFGRGSCDTKAGMAALVAALEPALREGTLRRNLVLVGEADEELSSLGAHAVLEHLADRRPDWAIATEPTGLRLVTHHKGVVHAHLCARGVAGHSSDPARGRNAIVALARGILSLDALATDLADRPDPRLGAGTLSVGRVEGGSAANIIPDRAALVLDRRVLPGEDADSVRDEVEACLARDGVDDVSVEWCRQYKAPLSTPDDHPGVQSCKRALVDGGLSPDTVGVAFGTDGGIFERGGIPSVVLGPGSIERAHTAREYVEVGQVEATTALFQRLLEST